MPAAFLGHGSPMNALEHNRYTASWAHFGATQPRPRAVVCLSAHWFRPGTAVTAMQQPPVIHDFGGFPPELFAYDYPAPGSPAVAREVAEVLDPTAVEVDETTWGLDHGTWSVLTHVYPEADVPVVQISLDATASWRDHYDLGVRLAPLREQGLLVVGSGNVVHNLSRLDMGLLESGASWARAFNETAIKVMTQDPAGVLGLLDHPDFAAAVPTAEHFLPLVYLAGMAAAANQTPEVMVDGYAMGSLSMTSFLLAA